ncbi:ankyrin repeat-containing protein BDA1-like isoform X2 [Papaver somniferum]|uniref:ankyrin repeat-containing protein BDA1-like isoform X2 n=1 Tax=Papaver somniferum TaxID=3469 RepID=UPI000E7002E2|nr:ankyrin repeat-containing protein BDA1-like isoform X2 [Papaver somniferum]
MKNRLLGMPKRVLVYFLKKLDSRLDNLDEEFTFFRRTQLHIAVLSNDINFARKILYLEPDLASKKDNRGWTPLHLASARASLEMVELLLMARRDVCTVQDNDQRTPLHLAVMNNRVEIMEVLTEEDLPKVINLNNDQNGETILHFCVKSNSSIETLELLADKLDLARASDPDILINSKDNDGKTVLQLAAETGNIEMVQYLLESSNLKLEITEADFDEAMNALTPKNTIDLQFKFLKYAGCTQSKKHNSNTLSRCGDKIERRKERVNALLVVATLIAGIAFQAAMNPPGGVWQDDSIVNSNTKPVIFGYYLNQMFSSTMSGGLREYLIRHSEGKQYSNIQNFVDALMLNYGSILSTQYKGLVLEDSGFTDVVSNYNNSDGKAMMPGFYTEAEHTFIKVQVFLGVCCILGVGSFIWTLVLKIVKLRKRKRHPHIGLMNYLKQIFYSMDAKDAGKLILFVVSYFGFRFHGYVCYGVWSYINHFWY